MTEKNGIRIKTLLPEPAASNAQSQSQKTDNDVIDAEFEPVHPKDAPAQNQAASTAKKTSSQGGAKPKRPRTPPKAQQPAATSSGNSQTGGVQNPPATGGGGNQPPQTSTEPVPGEPQGERSGARAFVETGPVMIFKKIIHWLEYNFLFWVIILFMIVGIDMLHAGPRVFYVGVGLIITALLMSLNTVTVLGNPPQRGVRKLGEQYYGPALPPFPYITAPYLLYNILVIDVSPLKGLGQTVTDGSKNPEWNFTNVTCNQKGLDLQEIWDPETSYINLNTLLQYKDGHDKKNKKVKYSISGVVDFKISMTIVPDDELPPAWMENHLIEGVSMNDTRLIWYIKYGQREPILNAIEAMVKEVINNIGGRCKWQTLANSPEIATQMITYRLTGQRPARSESTTEFMSRMSREGFPDVHGFGVRYREITVKVTPDPKLLDEVIQVARRETQTQQIMGDAFMFDKVIDKLRKVFPTLSDSELKNLVLIRLNNSENKIITFEGAVPGFVVTGLDLGGKSQ